MSDLIIIGAGGHAKVIADIAQACGYNVLGFLDDDADKTAFCGLKRLGKISDCVNFSEAWFVIAIGNNTARKSISEKHPLKYATLIHPSAVISQFCEIGEGTVVMPLCVINSHTKIGCHCILNTASVTEHDNTVGDFTHLSPNSTLCGTVKIGTSCHVGAGATVINNITICDNTVVGAGATVIKDITESGTYAGVPAKRIK